MTKDIMINHDNVSCPEDLTVPILTEMLQPGYPGILIESIAVKPVSSAILSNVVELEITTSNMSTPLKTITLIAKFLKPTLPLSEMFRVEGAFYQNVYQFPAAIFATPTCIACGPRFVLLEKVLDIRTYTLLESCPPVHIPELIRRMAHMHAYCWNAKDLLSKLSDSAGIGSALTGAQKQDLFAKHYTSFPGKYQELCLALNQLDLCDLHDRVHAFQPTMIHGDFHVGNLLFHKGGATAATTKDDVYLIDWATCGSGNPMVDLAFFFVVSTRGVSVKTVQEEWLPLYHRELVTSFFAHGKVNETRIGLKDLQRHFIHCLINQFVILVCYDQTARGLVQQETASSSDMVQQQMYNRHFDNVNHRCATAILESGAIEAAGLLQRPLVIVDSNKEIVEAEQQQESEPQLLTEI